MSVGSAACRVPVLVLPRPLHPAPPRLPGPVCGLWSALESALDRLRTEVAAYRPTGHRDRCFAAATRAAAALTAQLRAVADVPAADALPPPVPVHSEYFRVRHLAMTPAQQAGQAVAAVYRAVADLRHTMLDVNDVVAELDAALLMLHWYRPEPASGALTAGGPGPGPEPRGDLMDRWFVAHHFYFLLNVHAAEELEHAAALVRGTGDGGPELPAALRRTAVLVRGFTAAMLHSCALPAAFYQHVVRPTMSPPQVPIGLTGVMQVEHRRYRAALDGLLEALPAGFAELVDRRPELAAARNELLEADLLDLERHVTVAAVLVGTDRSLVQRATTVQNATSTLRKMRHRRARGYRDLMQFGDHWLDPAGARPAPATVAGAR